jgi:hypothetical protein
VTNIASLTDLIAVAKVKMDALERDIEGAVCKYAVTRGMLHYKFTSPAHVAVCDRIFIGNGKVWFAEFKKYGKKPTVAQSRHHQELAKHGIAVYVVDSIEMGKEIVDHEAQAGGKGHHRAAVRYVGGE